jgi:hypothetical protein
MLRSEQRPRSLSSAFRERCRHPGLKPVSVAEAEQLLRKKPLKDLVKQFACNFILCPKKLQLYSPYLKVEEDEFSKPRLPTCHQPRDFDKCKKLQVFQTENDKILIAKHRKNPLLLVQ